MKSAAISDDEYRAGDIVYGAQILTVNELS